MNNFKESGLTRNDLAELYEVMLTIRLFEENAISYFRQGIVLGNMHMYIGEEAIAAGVMKNLNKEDMISSTHRCDGHLIAKGADLGKMMAELMGKESGYCKGRGGKMHMAAPEVGVMCANGIVGASIPLAAGHALYSSLYNPGQVSVSFFGDGGANQGVFHEGINLAALWKLPVIFICENNQYAISTNVKTATSSKTIAQRAHSYDIPGVLVDGNDVIAVYSAAKEAVVRARSGEGPTLIECQTYRFRGHHEGDEQTYRTKEEANEWKEKRCPIMRLKSLLCSQYDWTDDEDQAIVDNVKRKIKEAVEYGMQGVPMIVEDVEKYVYAEEVQ